ncbi:MAG TPA: hypothetical protein VE567_04480, partial [Sphingomonas sp.]|nr:hypothetical protein [Sphingomonas sp.]
MRQIGIRAAVTTAYDSNAFGVSDALLARGAIPGRSKDDIHITPSLLVDVVMPFGLQSAFLRGQVGYDFYMNNSRLNRERIGLDGGANLRVIGACTVSPAVSYARHRSNAGDIFSVSPVPLVDQTNTEERISFGGSVGCAGAVGLSPTVSYR